MELHYPVISTLEKLMLHAEMRQSLQNDPTVLAFCAQVWAVWSDERSDPKHNSKMYVLYPEVVALSASLFSSAEVRDSRPLRDAIIDGAGGLDKLARAVIAGFNCATEDVAV